jgi:hypothetical protein
MSKSKASAARVAGKVYKRVMIAGREFTLSQPAKYGKFAEIEAFILSRKEDPMVAALRVCKRAPVEMHNTIWKAAMETASAARIATREDWQKFEDSKWPAVFMLWMAMDPKHREEFPTAESVADLIIREADRQNSTIDEIIMQASIVQQDAELKNSAGPSEAARA